MQFLYPEGATPLDADYSAQLIPSHITTQSQLNEWEAMNIQEARNWTFFKRRTKHILDIGFIKKLHTKMFNKTWMWAGQWRTCQTNIGIEPYRIVSELGQLLGDIDYYRNNGTYSMDEIAIRLHHRLVWIHPFPNGNGRHARFMADIFLKDQGLPFFDWGKPLGNSRRQYIEALQAADRHDYEPLFRFVRAPQV